MSFAVKVIVAFSLMVWFGSLVSPSVNAHGFGERYDLPIPLSYFLIGAGMTVVLSFVVIGYFVRNTSKNPNYPQLDLWAHRPFQVMTKLASVLIRPLTVFIMIIAICTGLYGTPDAIDNFTPTLVWIIWWVGIGYVVALIGNIWAWLNPWQVIFEWAEKIFGRRNPLFTWPVKLDAWPALAGFFLFAWIENSYTGSSRPFNLSFIIILYSITTWTGMFLFGKHVWLKKADPFSVLFSLFSRFSPTEVRVGQTNDASVCQSCPSGCAINADLPDCVDCYDCWERAPQSSRKFILRPWASGLTRGDKVSTSLVAFHITALATVTFDGLAETPAWVAIQTAVWPFIDPLPGNAAATIKTLGILLVPAIFAAAYIYLCTLVSQFSGNRLAKNDVIHSFVFSLVPIALAYNLSHYVSFLLISGQQIIPLLSNPFGFGLGNWDLGQGQAAAWNLFGTAAFVPNIAIIDAKFAWLFSVTSLVTGHVVSVLVAHIISLRKVESHRLAARSQYPMLVLMVFYTCISLWIIAQPIIE